MTVAGITESSVDAATAAAVVNQVIGGPQRHGRITFVARYYGVSRVFVYRVVGRFREGVCRGPGRPPKSLEKTRIEELQRENERYRRLNRRLAEQVRGLQQTWRRSTERIMFCLICVGLPARIIAFVLNQAFGVAVSHTTVLVRTRKYAAMATLLMQTYFWRAADDLDLDEVFVESVPVLVGVEHSSLAVCKITQAEQVTKAEWKRFLQEAGSPSRTTSDRGVSITAAVAETDSRHQSDLFHAKHAVLEELHKVEKKAYASIAAEYRAESKLNKRRTSGRDCRGYSVRYRIARRRAAEAIELLDDLQAGVNLAFEALQLSTADGRLNSPDRARELLDFAVQWIHYRLPKGWRKAKNGLKDPALLTHMDEFRTAVRQINVQVGSLAERERVLAELTRLWEQQASRRWRGKTVLIPPETEAALSAICHDLGQTTMQLFAVLDGLHRASSAVECINSRIGFYRYSKHRFSADFANLLAIWHNLTPFQEGKRKHRTPAELLGVQLPDSDIFALFGVGMS